MKINFSMGILLRIQILNFYFEIFNENINAYMSYIFFLNLIKYYR